MASFLISSSQGKEIHSGGWMWDYRNKSKSEIYLNIKWAQLLGKKKQKFRVQILKYKKKNILVSVKSSHDLVEWPFL